MRHLIISSIMKFINALIRKSPNSFYFTTRISCKNNCEDIFNYSGNNHLSCLSYMLKQKYKSVITITVEFADLNRKPLYEELVKDSKANNINLRFFFVPFSYSSKMQQIQFSIKRYLELFKHNLWIIGTGDQYLYGKLKSQKIINTNYFISCKNDYLPDDPKRWEFIDDFITCSVLHSTVSAAQTGVPLKNCHELGFPRNDCLFDNRNKSTIYSWIQSKIGYVPDKIFVYAPTYRDYEKRGSISERYLFGYDMPKLEQWLEENNATMVCKLHNLQARSILKYPKGVIRFECTYEFTFYELLSITDCLITDYSSVGYDYMLTDRPLIYNLYDYDYYVETRGVSYEPYDRFCPGVIVKNSEEMMNALIDVVNGEDKYKEKRQNLTNLFHKNFDNCSTERVVGLMYKIARIETVNE